MTDERRRHCAPATLLHTPSLNRLERLVPTHLLGQASSISQARFFSTQPAKPFTFRSLKDLVTHSEVNAFDSELNTRKPYTGDGLRTEESDLSSRHEETADSQLDHDSSSQPHLTRTTGFEQNSDRRNDSSRVTATVGARAEAETQTEHYPPFRRVSLADIETEESALPQSLRQIEATSTPASQPDREAWELIEQEESLYAPGQSRIQQAEFAKDQIVMNMNTAGHEASTQRTGQRRPPVLTHVNASGQARMVDVSDKDITNRIAIAQAFVCFSNDDAIQLIKANRNKKGDVIGVARIAGIMAAKRTSDLIPLCHPIPISKVEVALVVKSKFENGPGRVSIEARVKCTGQTGVEMEALTAVSVAALTIYDMCKAVDKEMVIKTAKVVYKSGGRSGVYVDTSWNRDWRGRGIRSQASRRVSAGSDRGK